MITPKHLLKQEIATSRFYKIFKHNFIMKISKLLFSLAVVTCFFISCDSVGTYPSPQEQLDDIQRFRRNLRGLAHNYNLSKDEINTLCSDSISKYIKVKDGKINLNVIDISMLRQFEKENKKPVYYQRESPNLFHFCANENSRKQMNFLAYSYITEQDTIWEKVIEKNDNVQNLIPKLTEWSEKFVEENVAIFYTLEDRSIYPKMEGNSYEPGVLTGLLILVDWDKIEPVCSIPCYSTNSDEIDFSYFVGTEQWAGMNKLKDDLVMNFGNELVKRFHEMGLNQVDSVKIHY